MSFDGDVDITKVALPEKNNDKTNGSQHADIEVIPGIDGNNPDIIIRDNLPSPGIDIQKETTTTNITPQNSVISLDSAYQSVGQTVRREAVSLNMKAENGVQGKLEVNGNAVLEGNVGQANNQQGNVEQSLTQQHGNDVPASGGDGQEEIGGAKPADIQHSGELGQGSLTGSEVNGRKQGRWSIICTELLTVLNNFFVFRTTNLDFIVNSKSLKSLIFQHYIYFFSPYSNKIPKSIIHHCF